MTTETSNNAHGLGFDFDQFYITYHSRFKLLASKYFKRDPERIRDIVQDVFLTVLQKWATDKTEKEVVALAYATLRNKCLNALQKLNFDTSQVRIIEKRIMDAFEDDCYHAEIYGAFMEHVKAEMVRLLEAKDREIIELFYLKGYSHEEIGNLLNKTPDYVKNRKNNAIRKIRHQLSHPEWQLLLSVVAMLPVHK